jgi:hypothetical protein
MTLESETKNQHFVSQAEQRLNSIPDQPGLIYALELVDRETYSVRPTKKAGESIRLSLSAHDLFTFDHVDEKVRRNFEVLFQRYEQDVGDRSKALLQKLGRGDPEIKAELLAVFAAKLLNFARNPFCVRKVLNTFGVAASQKFTDQALQEAYALVLNGSRDQEAAVCERYSIEPDLYHLWLRTLFMLLSVTPDDHNLFEQTIKGIFESSKVQVVVCHFTTPNPEDACLLSDRGFNQLPVELAGGASATMLQFNISARAFASFTFCDPKEVVAKNGLRPEVAALAAAQVHVQRLENNLELLRAYNRHTIYQCAERVFSACSTPVL